MRLALPVTVLSCSILAAVASCAGGSGNNTSGLNGLGGGDFASSSTSTSSGEGAHHATGSTSSSTSSGFHVPDGGGDGSKCSTAQTCESVNANCGKVPDGCGGILDCGTCKTGEVCGAVNPNQCDMPPCMAKSCMDQGIECGPAGDLCGNSLDCGTCPTGQTCGGGGNGKCGKKTQMCKPKSCEDQNLGCGMAGDLCGHQIDCGTCTLPDTCGGVTPGQCGHVQCMPQSCSDAGAECGQAPDGCGGLLDCGTCPLPKTCGGNGGFDKCEIPPTCTNLCLQQVSCAGSATTTFSGTVYAPNGTDPLPNVLVYVPNSAVAAFGDTVSCDNCASGVSGDPLVSAITDTSGNFQIQNMPTGSNIPVVVQTGRWREQYTVSSITACVDNAPDGTLKLPSTQLEGCTGQPCATNIPHMAFATGSYDALECVLRKIGVADHEFGAPGGGGRVDLYVADGAYAEYLTVNGVKKKYTFNGGGANAAGQSAGEPAGHKLWGSATTLAEYDMVLLPCEGYEYQRPSADQQILIDYTNAGGRLFTTHYSYVWLYNDAPFSNTANWNLNQDDGSTSDGFPPDQTGFINQTFPKGAALAQWLVNVCPQSSSPGSCTTLGQIPVSRVRDDNDSVVAPSSLWMSGKDPQNMVLHYTFNTPVGAATDAQCGRVLFDDFHVEDREHSPNTVINDGVTTGTYGYTFPAECDNMPMTPQEQLLEFMIFDLGSCVTSDVPVCTPKTCGDLNIDCGPAGDGCGKALDCGVCPTGQTCGLGGPSQCGATMCIPISCSNQAISCGPASDGCGNLQQCGDCPAGKTCGGGGVPGKCGSGGVPCTNQTCADQNLSCGPAGDGCGGMLDCGTCSNGQTCGGGGKPGQCGTVCNPLSCADQGFNCGPAGDGCGGEIMCGNCSNPQTCGGGGQPNVCGGSAPH